MLIRGNYISQYRWYIHSEIKIPVISWAYMYLLFLQCKFKWIYTYTVKLFSMRKQKSFQQIVWTNWISIWGGETKHIPTTPYIRINLRWTSNYKVKIIKFLKENRRLSLQPWYRQSFLKEKTEKEKNPEFIKQHC